MFKYFLPLFFLFSSSVHVFAQGDTVLSHATGTAPSIVNLSENEVLTPEASDGTSEFFITNKEAILSFFVLISLLLVLTIEIWLIKVVKINSDAAIKLILVSLVIMAALLLIMGGYSDKTIAPAFGLFGTIAGYILGKTDGPRKNDEKV